MKTPDCACNVVRNLNRAYGTRGCFGWCHDDSVRKDVQVALLLPLLPNIRHLEMPSWFEPAYLRHIISVRKTAVLPTPQVSTIMAIRMNMRVQAPSMK